MGARTNTLRRDYIVQPFGRRVTGMRGQPPIFLENNQSQLRQSA
jgi:hypothetical protein